MHAEIRDILERHRGKANPISAGEITKRLGLRQEDTHVEARQLILEAIEKYRLPVAAGGRGYYYITNEDELRAYAQTLENRAQKILKRRNNIEKFFGEQYSE